MNILFNGGFLGREALCYQGRGIVKQLAKYHDVRIDSQPIGGYWEKFFGKFKDKKPAEVYIMNGHVPHLPELAKKHKNIISITVFETKLPKEWVDALNIPEVKEIWTISKFCKKLISDSGVRKPIKVVYLGIDERFSKRGINLFPKDKSFKFLNVSAPHGLGKKDRKGLDLLIRAFKEEFEDDSKIMLLLKINTIYCDLYNRKRGYSFNLREYIGNLVPKGFKFNNIAILDEYLSTDTLNSLYNSVDCGVFPSRGEAFGLTQAEMMKVGKPVICTDYSAPNEFSDPRLRCKLKGMFPLDYNIYPYNDSLFGECDVAHLRKLMRQVYEKYEEESKIAEKHSKTLSNFDWDVIGENLNKIIKKEPSK